LTEQLGDMINRGDNASVAWLLGQMNPGLINQGDRNLNTPLHYACGRANNPTAVSALLKMPGILVNGKNCFDYTPIMFAAGRCNRVALVLMLDDERVDLEHCTRDGRRLEDVVGIDKGTWEQRDEIVRLIRDEKEKREIQKKKCEMYGQKKGTSEGYLNDDEADYRFYVKEDQQNLGKSYQGNQAMVAGKADQSTKDKKNTAEDKNLCEGLQKLEVAAKKSDAAVSSAPVEHEVEEVRETVRNQYAGKIDEFNKKIKQIEDGIVEKENNESELKETQAMEKKATVEKFRQEMKDLEMRMRKELSETDERHSKEMVDLSTNQKVEEDRKSIASMKQTVSKLSKDLENLDAGGANADVEAARDDMECPVCLEMMKPPTKIWMCSSTHLICQDCKYSLDDNVCPTCRAEPVTLRAYFAENMARRLFSS